MSSLHAALSDCGEARSVDLSGSLCLAVVVPCFRVKSVVRKVLEGIGPEVSAIYCVDDCCPEGSADVIAACSEVDVRIHLIRHTSNQGVGGAVLSGYAAALADGADVIVKLDGDGQMDPRLISALVAPIARAESDYVKGNRFFDLDSVQSMPVVRLIGNAGLSFLTKLSSGYWQLFDPTNGFTAISAAAARALPLPKISRRYFFESDILFRLNTIQAVVSDVPMPAEYGDEESSLSVSRCLFEFPFLHLRNTAKRIFYNYFLRGFSMASVHLVLGTLLLAFGFAFGITKWLLAHQSGEFASAGTVMLSALPVILGMQMLLSFVNFDMASVPGIPLCKRLSTIDRSRDVSSPKSSTLRATRQDESE